MFATFALVVSIALLTSFYLYRKFVAHRYFQRLGIPGPKPHWLYGNLKDFLDNNRRHLVMQEWGRRFGPFFGYFEGATPILVVNSVEAVEQICIKQYANFQGHRISFVQPDPSTDMDSPVFSPNVLFAWGQHWKRLRSNVNAAFSTGKLKSYMPLIRKSQTNLLKSLDKLSQTRQPFDIYQQFQCLTNDVIGEIAFGVEMGSLGDDNGQSNPILQNLKVLVGQVNDFPTPFRVATVFSEIAPFFIKFVKFQAEKFQLGQMKCLLNIEEVCEKVIKQRLANPELRRADLLQNLIDCSELSDANKGLTEPLTAAEVIAQSVVFFAAGTETTSTALAFSAYVLSANASVQAKLFSEIEVLFEKSEELVDYDAVMSMPYLDWFVSEVLRMYPMAAYVVNRFVMADTEISGVPFPKSIGNVLVDVYSIHYDQDNWGPVDVHQFHPERFSPSYKEMHPRSDAAFLPFGFGPRICVGQRLALLELKMTIANILHRYKILEKPGGYPGGLPVSVMTAILPKHGVLVQLEPRS